MNFAFSEEQEELRKVVRDFLDNKSDEATVRAKMAEFLASARERVIGPAK